MGRFLFLIITGGKDTMQIELNRNELKELIDKISFLITDVDKRTDKRKESERSNKNNHFGILSMGRYPRSEYPSSFFISFISIIFWC